VWLSSLFNAIQTTLFPALEEEYGELTEKESQFIKVAELSNIAQFTEDYTNPLGRPNSSRCNIALGFIAKVVFNIINTKALIDTLKRNATLRRLCGWESINEIPSESTFSRAFAEFANTDLLQRVHEAMVKTHYNTKIAGHVSRDSTPISAREKAAKKQKPGSKDQKNMAEEDRKKVRKENRKNGQN
jgi:hypothetical protein